jgi:hypothetical protein
VEILRERKVWKAPRKKRWLRESADSLTPEETDNVRIALRALKMQHGTWNGVARALGVDYRSVSKPMETGRRPTAGLAVRVAKLVGVTVDAVLRGEWPGFKPCPTCGRMPYE